MRESVRKSLVSIALAAMILACGLAFADDFGAGDLDGLPRLKDYEAKRVSSYQRNNGNWDYVRINAGESHVLAELEGPGMITHIWVTMAYRARGGYRKMVLKMYFDGAETPCVLSPIGDFFGLGNGQRYTYESEALSVGTEGGMNSFWKMPFYKSAKITVENQGKQDCGCFYYYVDYRKYDKLPPDLGLFHAVYRQEMPCKKGVPYLIMDATGQGHFAGVNLSIEQTEDNWWGEGDDLFYVDGDTSPTLNGTGTEDYFCGAWGFSHEFGFDDYGQPYRAKRLEDGTFLRYSPDLRGPSARGFQWPQGWVKGALYNVYRYHVEDPIPFKKSLKFEMEHGAVDNEQQNNYSSVVYWYQTEPHATPPALPEWEERLPDFMWPTELKNGKFEGEDFIDVASTTGGEFNEDNQWFWGDIWSGTAELSWVPSATDDVLLLPISLDREGEYSFGGKLTKGKEGGQFSISVDEKEVADFVDLYEPALFPSPKEHEFGEVSLATGEHEIRMRYLGSSPDSEGKRLGIDFVQFELKE